MLLHTLSNIANPFVPLPWLIKGKHWSDKEILPFFHFWPKTSKNPIQICFQHNHCLKLLRSHIFFELCPILSLKNQIFTYRYYLKESIFWFFLPQKLGTFTWSNRFPNWRWILHFQKNHVATMCITTRVISLDFLFLSFLCKLVTSCDIGTPHFW